MAEMRFRPCCSDAVSRLGEAAPLLDAGQGRFVPGDDELPAIEIETRRSVASARHEIGHVLATIALGGVVEKVTIDGQPSAFCELPAGAPWQHRAAVDLAGDGAGRGELPADELNWHVRAVRNCGGGRCDKCNAARSITIGLRHPPDEDVVVEFRRIEAILAAFFSHPDVRELVFELAWCLVDEGTISGDDIEMHFGPRVRDLKLSL